MQKAQYRPASALELKLHYQRSTQAGSGTALMRVTVQCPTCRLHIVTFADVTMKSFRAHVALFPDVSVSVSMLMPTHPSEHLGQPEPSTTLHHPQPSFPWNNLTLCSMPRFVRYFSADWLSVPKASEAPLGETAHTPAHTRAFCKWRISLAGAYLSDISGYSLVCQCVLLPLTRSGSNRMGNGTCCRKLTAKIHASRLSHPRH